MPKDDATLSAASVGSHAELHMAVRALLNGVNASHPEKNPREWTCPHMQALDDMTQLLPQSPFAVELRDHFAAAAMAGLIAEGGDWRLDYIGRPCIRAYEWADAMLRERERTNHGALPEAIARTDGGSVGTDKAEPLTHQGTGDTFSPILKRETDSPQAVAWRAFDTDGSEAVYSLYEQARAAADEWNWSVEPLYRTPEPHATPGDGTSHGGCTLTPEEREALATALFELDSICETDCADALRGLLARLS